MFELFFFVPSHSCIFDGAFLRPLHPPLQSDHLLLLSLLDRPYWRCYYSNTDAVIYVVDSSDRDRMGISKSELVAMLEVNGLTLNYHLNTLNKSDVRDFTACSNHHSGSRAVGMCSLKLLKNLWEDLSTANQL